MAEPSPSQTARTWRFRPPRWLLLAGQIVLLAGAAAFVFGLSAYLSMRVVVLGSDVEVPRVLAIDVESARKILAGRELLLETSGSRHSDLVPEGEILSQQPAPGENLKPGRKVKVLVSLGPEQFRAPDLIGMPVPRARVLLSQGGLRLGSVAFVHSTGQQDNLVLAQDPPAGAGVQKEGRVDLLVSRGAAGELRIMPDLVGSRLADARTALARQGFRVDSVRNERDRTVAPGNVLRQSPPAGYPVQEKDTISLVVSE